MIAQKAVFFSAVPAPDRNDNTKAVPVRLLRVSLTTNIIPDPTPFKTDAHPWLQHLPFVWSLSSSVAVSTECYLPVLLTIFVMTQGVPTEGTESTHPANMFCSPTPFTQELIWHLLSTSPALLSSRPVILQLLGLCNSGHGVSSLSLSISSGYTEVLDVLYNYPAPPPDKSRSIIHLRYVY